MYIITNGDVYVEEMAEVFMRKVLVILSEDLEGVFPMEYDSIEDKLRIGVVNPTLNIKWKYTCHDFSAQVRDGLSTSNLAYMVKKTYLNWVHTLVLK